MTYLYHDYYVATYNENYIKVLDCLLTALDTLAAGHFHIKLLTLKLWQHVCK